MTYYAYDKNNRLVRITKPLLQETSYEYDAAGNRTAVNDAKGQRSEYAYNAINRMTQVRHYGAGDHQNPVKTVDFTYDALGNVKTYSDGVTSATYTYDDLSRKVAESINYGPFSLTYGYSYYANGVKKAFMGPDGEVVNYAYDENNRLSSVTIPSQGQITYNEYQWNSPIKVTLPGGSSTDYTYEPLMRIKTILAKDPGQNPLMTRGYQYSPAGNITSKDTEHGSYAYQYDTLNRLTGADNPTLQDEAYTYDLLGNRITSAGVTGAWSYNANNELLGYGSNSFNYDANGNMVQKTAGGLVTNYIYNVEDRLTEVRDGSGNRIATYYYDPFGRRLWKEVDGVRVYFLYSDEGLIGEYDALGTELRTYGYVPDGNWTTDPLFQKSGGIYYWYRNDHLGTPQKITATSGAVLWAGTYDSFGNVQINTVGITNNLRFGGQYYDAETGLYYNLNRYYDPTTGRYLRADPFGDGINLYAYVFNNPNGLIDPMGLCAVSTGFNFLGRALGTGFGEEAAMWYAQRFNETGSWYFAAGGLSASLWTPETYLQTAITLATAPLVAAKITVAGTRSAGAAARAAVREVVEEVIGIPVFSSPRGLFPSKLKGLFASKNIEKVLSGHGAFRPQNGFIKVPEGTSVTTWTKHGNTISDKLGNYIETGKNINFSEFGDEIIGAKSYLPGSKMPNYTLYPPEGLNIMGNPTTVT